MNKRFLAGFMVLGVAAALQGCQSGDTANVLNIGKKKAPPVQDDRITAQELRAYCPRVELREGTAYFNTYEKGGKDDPNRVVYQISIAEVTRSCNYNGGTMSMNVAVAGKAVPGPKARSSEVTLPIRVVVLKGGDVVYSQLHKHTISIGAGGAQQFVFNDSGVNFPMPTERDVIVYAGFDEGPYNTP